MFSSVQGVFLFDVNCFGDACKTESELERNVAQLKLASLKLLTEFGAQTEKGLEVVRWSSKYYDSLSYKPNTSRKNFIDFNRSSFLEFENSITDCFCSAFDRKHLDNGGDNQTNDAGNAENKPHSFILRKALQEILLDYNWDRPDISSPVKRSSHGTGRRSSRGNGAGGVLPENQGPYNTVVVFTNVPQSLDAVGKFCGSSVDNEGGKTKTKEKPDFTAEDYLGNILDTATYKGFQEDKKISLNFVAINFLEDFQQDLWKETFGNKTYSTIHIGLSKLGGGLHHIANIVEASSSVLSIDDCIETSKEDSIFPFPRVRMDSIRIRAPWFKKSKASRPRRPQKGPTLVWEDAEGISSIRVDLEVLAVHGSSSRGWGSASVVAVIQNNSLNLLAMAAGTGHLYVCHAPNTIFTKIINFLDKYRLAMVLKLNCGGIAILTPWAGGVGSLAVVSASGLTTPPIFGKSCQDIKANHPSILKFVTQASEKCLKSAPPHSASEPEITTKNFAVHQTARWFKPLPACEGPLRRISKKKAPRIERLAMQERLQKKYRPQIPRALATGEIEKVDLVDITQPPTDPEPGPSTKSNMSRAQKLVKKSHIVTAQQKVKEQLAEEEERVQATERKVALASEQARKSIALESHVMNTVSDPQNTQELIQSLIHLRENNEKDTDTYTTAQTIINLALMHIRNSSNTAIENEMCRILGDGVLQSVPEVNSSYSPESRLSQYKLQTLLHLELLWLCGYSTSCEMDEEEQNSRGGDLREFHIGEAVKLLRAISLTNNPTTMAQFMQETVLENYGETLGEVLVELFEELNQPLPESLRVLTGDLDSVYDARASSVRSMGSMTGPDSNYSFENPEEKKLVKHPSIIEANKNRIVVPMATRALKRTKSEQAKQTSGLANKESSETEIQKVRRNLFDLSEGPSRSRLRRSHTVDHVPVSELRRSPRKKDKPGAGKSPSRKKGYQKTPLKGLNSSEGHLTPKLKKVGVFAPETPTNKLCQTIFNKRRICKSTGTTLVTESPEVKRMSRTTPRKVRPGLTVSRQNSFYSGARSRNWERAKTQLLADRFRGKLNQRSFDQHPSQNLGASFLFPENICMDQDSNVSECDGGQERNDYHATPKRKTFHFGLDEDSESIPPVDIRSNVVYDDSSEVYSKLTDDNSTRNSLMFGSNSATPSKNIKRALSLCTPSKAGGDSHETGQCLKSPGNSSKINTNAFCPVTPKRFNKLNFDATSCDMTPSKRVQFSFTSASNHQTPRSKMRSASDTPATPKSILKTPKKTPSKTPRKGMFASPDLFSSSVKQPRSPFKTPLKGVNSVSQSSQDSLFSGFSDEEETSPVKVRNMTSYEQSEIELVSPVKNHQGSSKASLIVHNTPKKDLPVKSLFDTEEGKAEVEIDEGDILTENAVSLYGEAILTENTGNLDERDILTENAVSLDQDDNLNLPDFNLQPEEIEMMNSLMFDSFDIDSHWNPEDIVFNTIEDIEPEYYHSEKTFQSPLKYGTQAYIESNTQLMQVSLPDKQEIQDIRQEFNHSAPDSCARNSFNQSINQGDDCLSESVEFSPSVNDTRLLPTLDTILDDHLRDQNEEDNLELSNGSFESKSPILNTEEKTLNADSEEPDSTCNYSYSTNKDTENVSSPEIPLDLKALRGYEMILEGKTKKAMETDNTKYDENNGENSVPVDEDVKELSPDVSFQSITSWILSSSMKKNMSSQSNVSSMGDISCSQSNTSVKLSSSMEENVSSQSDEIRRLSSDRYDILEESQLTSKQKKKLSKRKSSDIGRLSSSPVNANNSTEKQNRSDRDQSNEHENGEFGKGSSEEIVSSEKVELRGKSSKKKFSTSGMQEEIQSVKYGSTYTSPRCNISKEKVLLNDLGKSPETDFDVEPNKTRPKRTSSDNSQALVLPLDRNDFENIPSDGYQSSDQESEIFTRKVKSPDNISKGVMNVKSSKRKLSSDDEPEKNPEKYQDTDQRNRVCKRKSTENNLQSISNRRLSSKNKSLDGSDHNDRRTKGKKNQIMRKSSESCEGSSNIDVVKSIEEDISLRREQDCDVSVQKDIKEKNSNQCKNSSKRKLSTEGEENEMYDNPRQKRRHSTRRSSAVSEESLTSRLEDVSLDGDLSLVCERDNGDEFSNSMPSFREKAHRKTRRGTLVASTPVDGTGQRKRRITNSDSSGNLSFENKRRFKSFRTRQSSRNNTTTTRKSDRKCKLQRTSFKEPSSDDENYDAYLAGLTPDTKRKRIFDNDEDFATPPKSKCSKKSKKLPLKNMENFCNEEIGNSNQVDNSEYNKSCKTPCKKEKQQKIDVYLSPIQEKGLKAIRSESPLPCKVEDPKRKRAQTPNDWKRIKPRRGIKRQRKEEGFYVETSIDTSKGDTSIDINERTERITINESHEKKMKPKKKKKVKLKLTKSGNNYEVSKIDLSLGSSDPNSSTADPEVFLSELESSKNSNKDSSKYNSPAAKKKKKSHSNNMITPLRFTRHMSKDLSVSPEFFSQLIALSPAKAEDTKDVDEDQSKQQLEKPNKKQKCEILNRKRDLLKHFNGKAPKTREPFSEGTAEAEDQLSSSSYQSKDHLADSEWTVQSLPGSPTLKTFIRKQRNRYAIKKSPRVTISPIKSSRHDNLSDPSLNSLLHLSTSPIVNTIQTDKMGQKKPKSSRKLHKDSNLPSAIKMKFQEL